MLQVTDLDNRTNNRTDQSTIYLQEVPYTEQIPDGLRNGDWIVVKGCPKKSRGRYSYKFHEFKIIVSVFA